jgi:hypothetical protein
MDVQRADPKLRVAALVGVILIFVLGAVLWVMLQRWLTELKQVPASAAQAQLLTAFAWAFGSVCVAVIWLATSLWRSGIAIRRAAQWPLPGSRVVRDTPVLRGEAAVARGRLMQVSGVVLFLCAACIAVVAWRVYYAFAGAV